MSLIKLKDGRSIELEDFNKNVNITFDHIDLLDEDSKQDMEFLFDTLFSSLHCHWLGTIHIFGKIAPHKALETVLQKKGPETEEIWKSYMIKKNGFDIFTLIRQLIDRLQTHDLIILSDYLSYLYYKRKTVDIFFISEGDFQQIKIKFKTTLYRFICSNRGFFLFDFNIENYNKIHPSFVTLFKNSSLEDFKNAFERARNDSSDATASNEKLMTDESSDATATETLTETNKSTVDDTKGLKPFPDIEGLPTNNNFNLLAGLGSIISPDVEVVHFSVASVASFSVASAAQVYAERRGGKEKED